MLRPVASSWLPSFVAVKLCVAHQNARRISWAMSLPNSALANCWKSLIAIATYAKGVALARDRQVDPDFEHFAPDPVSGDGWEARVFIGSLLGSSSPTYTPYMRAFAKYWFTFPAAYLAWFVLPLAPWLRTIVARRAIGGLVRSFPLRADATAVRSAAERLSLSL